ncbi:MAG: hypothetical protein ACUVX8_04730 [Candidatus Zipacnadales bacterium]
MSGRRLLAIARKEWIHIWRDPRNLAVAMLIPIALLLITGMGINFDLNSLPFVLYDLDGSQASRSLRENLIRTGLFDLTVAVSQPAAGEKLLR